MDAYQFKNWLSQYQKGEQVSPLLMGIANVTPDSFSDGQAHQSMSQIMDKILSMIANGADIIDIGGESTRPGATPVSVAEELERIMPVIKQLHKESDICISVDTYKAEVMKAALDAGANIINDVNGLRCIKAMKVAVDYKVPVCVMHMQGQPQTMQASVSHEEDMVMLVSRFFDERLLHLMEAGVLHENIILDPGIGFGKTYHQNLNLINHLQTYLTYKSPLLLGVSRKSVVGYALDRPVNARLYGSLSLNVIGYLNGARIFRTHDVLATKDAIQMARVCNSLKSH